MNEWRDILHSKNYQISVTGEVRRKLKYGKFRPIKTYRKKNKWLVVKVDLHGKLGQHCVHTLMAATFGLKKKEGEVLHFKNGDLLDPALTNLEYIDRRVLGKLTGAMSARRPVAKLSPQGEIVEIYTSGRECARKNFFSPQAITDRCNGKVKKKIAPDGFVYIWEEKFNYEEATCVTADATYLKTSKRP